MTKVYETTKFWLVVWNENSGDYKISTMLAKKSDSVENVRKRFEFERPDYKVIHIGEGERPPVSYQSLETI